MRTTTMKTKLTGIKIVGTKAMMDMEGTNISWVIRMPKKTIVMTMNPNRMETWMVMMAKNLGKKNPQYLFKRINQIQWQDQQCKLILKGEA
eukprot:907976-Prorocentrum_lima.AAC.1